MVAPPKLSLPAVKEIKSYKHGTLDTCLFSKDGKLSSHKEVVRAVCNGSGSRIWLNSNPDFDGF